MVNQQSADCYKETLAKYLSDFSHGEQQPPQSNQSCCSIYNQDSKSSKGDIQFVLVHAQRNKPNL